uniref:Adaptor related protein complex 3 subunit sigma 1 n=1 Tax=Bos taurus TaxID=9913 RepID=A0AAA9TC74_BOVIN
DPGEGGVVGGRQRPPGDPLRRVAALLAPRPPRAPGCQPPGGCAGCPPPAALPSSDVAFLRRLLRLSVGWVASRLCGRGPGDFPVRGRSGSGGCSPPERAGFAAHPGLQPAPVSSRGRLLEPSEDTQQQIIRETFHLVSKRDENVCNFLEGGLLIGGSDNKLIYRHYATLYFVFCVDSSESELGILDLIQVFVETLDKCFENVCELDLIFHVDKVHNILAEMVMGGMVLETNMNEIVTQIDAQNKLEKSEAGLAGAPARAVSAVKNMNLPEIPRNINIGDISIKVPNLPSFK